MEEVPPGSARARPTGHCEHCLAPLSLAKVPGAHSRQAEALLCAEKAL